MLTIEKISGISNTAEIQKNTRDKEVPSFKDTLQNFIADVNTLQKDAGKSIEKLATGEIEDLHEVVIAVEKAGISFELMMEIRNKMLEAYQEIMRMQV